MTDSDENLAIEKYKLIYDLWNSENSVKTNKLQVLLATNAILVSAFSLTSTRSSIWIAFVGFTFSTVWILSIGRTVSYQEHWKNQLEEIRRQYSSNTLFQIHSAPVKHAVWGRVPSKYYLLGTPIATAISWLIVLFVMAL